MLFESSEAAVEIMNASSVIEKCRGAGAAVDVRLSEWYNMEIRVTWRKNLENEQLWGME